MNARGSALIDASFALLVLGIVMSSVGGLLATGIVVSRENENRTHAANLAQEELEWQRSLDYGAVGDRTQAFTWNGREFTVATTVAEDEPVDGMKEITVAVTWDERRGERTFVARSMYTSVRR